MFNGLREPSNASTLVFDHPLWLVCFII